MEIFQVEMHCFAANCYLVASEAKNCVIIDPGMEPENIIAEIEKRGLTPRYILLTHAHYDHMTAAPALREKYPSIKLLLGAKDVPLLTDARKNYSVTAVGHEVTMQPDETLKDGDEVTLDELTFRVLETPGHTAGGVCYLCGDAIFTGDTLFVQNCGRTDMFSSDFMDMVDSLTRLRHLTTNYKMYPGHESEGMLFDQFTWIDSVLERVKNASW